MDARRGTRPHTTAALLTAAAVAMIGVGCAEDDPAQTVVADGQDLVAPMALLGPSAKLPPTGTSVANKLEFLEFRAEGVVDAFGRSGNKRLGVFGLFEHDPFFDTHAWNLWGPDQFGDDQGGQGTARNSTNDPRLPALGGLGTEGIRRFCVLGDPAFGGLGDVGGWDLFCELLGLRPNTEYTIMFVRYALQVNGALDQEEMLLDGTVTEPDQLVPLGGTPGGTPEYLCDFTVAGSPLVQPDVNPFVVGWMVSDANGLMQFLDCVIRGNGFWYGTEYASSHPPAEEAPFVPFGQNVLGASISLPVYNYVVLVEGRGTATNPVPAGDHVIRWQVAADISQFGTVVNNSFAPFPTAQLGPAELATGNGAKSQPDSVTVTLSNLEALSGGAVYQAWFLTPGGPTVATGSYDNLDDADVPVDTSSFVGGAGRHQLVLDFPDASVGATHVFLTIEDAPGLTSPSNRQPFWVSAIQEIGSTKTTSQTVRFGTFADGGEGQRLWAISGTGLGGLFANELRINFEHLPRPPVGYQYVGWLMGTDTTLRLPDESFTSPAREFQPLTDADTEQLSDVVLPLEILRATQRFCLTAVSGCPGPFALVDSEGSAIFGTYVLTLEPKIGAAGASPTQVLVGDLPSP